MANIILQRFPIFFQGHGPSETLQRIYTNTSHLFCKSNSLHLCAFSFSKQEKWCTPGRPNSFLVNVPPDATERDLVQLFKGAGTVERVVFNADNTEGSVHFEEDESEEEEDEEVPVVEGEKPRKRRKISKEDVPKVTPFADCFIAYLAQNWRLRSYCFSGLLFTWSSSRFIVKIASLANNRRTKWPCSLPCSLWVASATAWYCQRTCGYVHRSVRLRVSQE